MKDNAKRVIHKYYCQQMTTFLCYSQAVRYILHYFILLKILKIPIQKLLLITSVGLPEMRSRKLYTTQNQCEICNRSSAKSTDGPITNKEVQAGEWGGSALSQPQSTFCNTDDSEPTWPYDRLLSLSALSLCLSNAIKYIVASQMQLLQRYNSYLAGVSRIKLLLSIMKYLEHPATSLITLKIKSPSARSFRRAEKVLNYL